MGKVYYVSLEGSNTNEGSFAHPWQEINYALNKLNPGDSLLLREGNYKIRKPLRLNSSGKEWEQILISAFKDEEVIINAINMDITRKNRPGVFHLEKVKHIHLKNLVIKNSKGHGIKIVDSSNINISNCKVENTYACGISMWDTDHDGQHCENNKIMYNTVIKANTWDMLPENEEKKGEPPHEAISIGGGTHFEVAYNHVFNCDKEGIDVKEVSRHGQVHHNYIHNLKRQGLYADAWFGDLIDVQFYKNLVKDCQGAGIAVSVEGGSLLKDVSFYENLVYNNDGTGILFARWGDDGPRRNVNIYNNTVVHNGHGDPGPNRDYFWITGGLYLFSANLKDINIFNNIFSDNNNFEIGYSDLYLKEGEDINRIFENKNINIENNLINDNNNLDYPIYNGWENNYAYIYPYTNKNNLQGKPEFVNPDAENFQLKDSSPALKNGIFKKGMYPGILKNIGAFAAKGDSGLWFDNSFVL